jgi:hypothetical protein
MKMSSKQRPLPSNEIRMPTRFSPSIQAKDVNWLLWSMLMISGGPNFWIASFSASTQKSASSVLEMRKART